MIFLTGNYVEESAGDDLPAKMYPEIGDYLEIRGIDLDKIKVSRVAIRPMGFTSKIILMAKGDLSYWAE